MRIIISPAKKMRVDTDGLPISGLPQFVGEAERLKGIMQAMTAEELKALWKCSDTLAKQNIERLHTMDLRRRLTPAILSYEGIQYRSMAPGVFETQQLEYIGEHLRILSGFYGLLRPFDGVTPYRLEMQARLPVEGKPDLYAFWGTAIAAQLAEETDVVINLASKEYSKAVEPHLPSRVRFVTCTFGELRDGRIVEKGTQCKIARGQMVRWMAENEVGQAEELCRFAESGYCFAPERSAEDRLIFIREGKTHDDG